MDFQKASKNRLDSGINDGRPRSSVYYGSGKNPAEGRRIGAAAGKGYLKSPVIWNAAQAEGDRLTASLTMIWACRKASDLDRPDLRNR